MKKPNEQYRQGDVLIECVGNTPEPDTAKRMLSVILAEGEVTGHHHKLELDQADWWKGDSKTEFMSLTHWRDGRDQFFAAEVPATVTHQEHNKIDLPAGTYRVIRQREYSPEEIRNVAD